MTAILTCAHISADVYNDTPKTVVGYHPVALANAVRWFGDSFFGAAYAGADVGVIAFRGSQELQDFTDADVEIFKSRLPVHQLGNAFGFFLEAEKALSAMGCERFVITGHSLGGGLAEAVAARISRVPVSAATFNAPGIVGFTEVGDHGELHMPVLNRSIVNVRSSADQVSLWGYHIGQTRTVEDAGLHGIGPLIEALVTHPVGAELV
jgi:hypothetical protein